MDLNMLPLTFWAIIGGSIFAVGFLSCLMLSLVAELRRSKGAG